MRLRGELFCLVVDAGSGLLPGPACFQRKAWFLPEAPPPAAAEHIRVLWMRCLDAHGSRKKPLKSVLPVLIKLPRTLHSRYTGELRSLRPLAASNPHPPHIF